MRLEVFDHDVRGLILRVGPTGKRSWVFRYRTADGVQRPYVLGIFLNDLDQSETETLPEGDAKRQALSLFQARALARDLINKVWTCPEKVESGFLGFAKERIHDREDQEWRKTSLSRNRPWRFLEKLE